VARHIKKHGGDVERSLAAVATGRSTRESLDRSAMPRSRPPSSILARPRRRPAAMPIVRPATPSARPRATASGFVYCGPMLGAAWAPSS
jgi:hypothetical protein